MFYTVNFRGFGRKPVSREMYHLILQYHVLKETLDLIILSSVWKNFASACWRYLVGHETTMYPSSTCLMHPIKPFQRKNSTLFFLFLCVICILSIILRLDHNSVACNYQYATQIFVFGKHTNERSLGKRLKWPVETSTLYTQQGLNLVSWQYSTTCTNSRILVHYLFDLVRH